LRNLYGAQPKLVAELARALESWAQPMHDDTALELARAAVNG
jgi:hypothetical protein